MNISNFWCYVRLFTVQISLLVSWFLKAPVFSWFLRALESVQCRTILRSWNLVLFIESLPLKNICILLAIYSISFYCALRGWEGRFWKSSAPSLMRSEEFSSSSELRLPKSHCQQGFGLASYNFSALFLIILAKLCLAPAKTNYMWEHKWPVSSWLYFMCTVFIFWLPVFIHHVFPGHRCPTSGFGLCTSGKISYTHMQPLLVY